MGGLGGAVERLAGSVGPVCQLRPVRPLMVGIVRRRLIFKYTLRIITMNAKFENSNSLLLNISPETKNRVIEKLFPNTELCYGDQITYNLTMLRQVCSALSKLCSLNEEEEGGAVEIGGEIALALSGLLFFSSRLFFGLCANRLGAA